MRRMMDQVMSTVNIKGILIASKAVLIKGKLRGCLSHISCEISDYCTSLGVLVHRTI